MNEKQIGGVTVIEGTPAELKKWREDQAARADLDHRQAQERAELGRAARRSMEDQKIEEARREN